MTELDNWQMQLNGLLMGRNTVYRIATTPDGLGVPPMRVKDIELLGYDGATAEGDWQQARPVSVELVIAADAPATAEDAARTLAGVWQATPNNTQLFVRLAGPRTYRLEGRPRRCELKMGRLASGIVTAAVQFVALDPLLYAADPDTAQLALGAATQGGVDMPMMLPAQFGGVDGLLYANNAGTAATYPRFTITGPATNPRIENATTGQTLKALYTLAANDTVVLDARARTCTLNGVNRFDLVDVATSTWWSLPPGQSVVAYRADTTNTTSRCTVEWRSAWM